MIFNILLICATTVLIIDVIATLIAINRKEIYCVTRVVSDKKDLLMLCRSEQSAMKRLHMLNGIGLLDKGVSYQIEKRIAE